MITLISEKLSGSVEINLMLLLNKLRDAGVLLVGMNIASPSGTNKQLPKPPPAGHSSAARTFKERKTSLKYFYALFLFPLASGLEVERHSVTCAA